MDVFPRLRTSVSTNYNLDNNKWLEEQPMMQPNYDSHTNSVYSIRWKNLIFDTSVGAQPTSTPPSPLPSGNEPAGNTSHTVAGCHCFLPGQQLLFQLQSTSTIGHYKIIPTGYRDVCM